MRGFFVLVGCCVFFSALITAVSFMVPFIACGMVTCWSDWYVPKEQIPLCYFMIVLCTSMLIVVMGLLSLLKCPETVKRLVAWTFGTFELLDSSED